jgi:hypothetical protein
MRWKFGMVVGNFDLQKVVQIEVSLVCGKQHIIEEFHLY